MNTKIFFAFLFIALLVSACTPTVVQGVEPVAPAVQSAAQQTSVIVPVTGRSNASVPSIVQESRLASGEIFLSDSNSPDRSAASAVHTAPKPTADCMSEDSQPRPQGGCTE